MLLCPAGTAIAADVAQLLAAQPGASFIEITEDGIADEVVIADRSVTLKGVGEATS